MKYEKWKGQNDPNYKPWINPEMNRTPRIDWNDIKEIDMSTINQIIEDSTEIDESAIKEDDLEQNDD